MVEGSDNGWLSVDWRVLLIISLSRVFGGVIFCAFLDPTTDQRDLNFVKWIVFFWHFRVAITIRSDLCDQVAFVWFARNNRDGLFPSGQEALEVGHDIVAIIL